jgi:hypothetical protein
MSPNLEIPDSLPSVQSAITQLETCVRAHPVRTLAAATGLGLAIVVLARSLAPSPRNRASALLEDIQHSLAELAHLGYDRASEISTESAHAVAKGVKGLGALHLDQKLDRLGQGIKNLFR